ncbi:hypothetical protein BN1051_01670 [Arthrobacter saudimassiliensis]|uniref:Uncharacterized protein n=1 Tax=Arthrobacter saudimassiliensis TaxID=1461584 RepID=A0A078MM15_9MICC|nr:hypothetical protein BN1051_01670 [Arthrobacter saudimassiliensis]
MTNGPESVDAPRRSRRAADVPADAGRPAPERESQQRARDREALRAYKALTENQPKPAAGSAAPPTRRQLRLQQQRAAQEASKEQQASKDQPAPKEQQEASAPGRRRTAGPEAGTADGGSAGTEAAPAAKEPAPKEQARSPRKAQDSGTAAPAAKAPASKAPTRSPRAAGRPGDAAAAAPKAAAAATKAVPGGTKAAQDGPAKAAPSRRARRLAEAGLAADGPSAGAAAERPKAPAGAVPADADAPKPADRPGVSADTAAPKRGDAPSGPTAGAADKSAAPGAPAAGADEDPNADVANMSVEQALAARQALEGQARNQVAMMEAMRKEDPYSVDLELLAQQKALAERAAVLNKRTQNIQRLSEENQQRRPQANDPTTAHNLAMVTPLEFVRVPGMDRPVMKRPPTAHVPIVTDRQPQAPAQQPARSQDRRSQPRAAARDAAADAAAEARHARILARADALVNAPLDPDQGAHPIGARSAFGLDPLDVMTAGLGRTRRMRWVSFGLAGAGFAALVTSILLIVSGFGS